MDRGEVLLEIYYLLIWEAKTLTVLSLDLEADLREQRRIVRQLKRKTPKEESLIKENTKN
jgi:heme exporter protein D